MALRVTVLGTSGSYLHPGAEACSGFLVRSPSANVLLDCGFGVLARLAEHLDPASLDAVFLSHIHPDHCADVFNLNGYLRRRGGGSATRVVCPEGMRERLDPFVEEWAPGLTWHPADPAKPFAVGGLTLEFQRTDHGPETYACLVRDGGDGGGTVVYTADTGPGWSPAGFGVRPDLLISDAMYERPPDGARVHLTAEQAGRFAEQAGARRLLLTHFPPDADRDRSVSRAAAVFGGAVTAAAAHDRLTIE